VLTYNPEPFNRSRVLRNIVEISIKQCRLNIGHIGDKEIGLSEKTATLGWRLTDIFETDFPSVNCEKSVPTSLTL
jgi:hypothetical protein